MDFSLYCYNFFLSSSTFVFLLVSLARPSSSDRLAKSLVSEVFFGEEGLSVMFDERDIKMRRRDQWKFISYRELLRETCRMLRLTVMEASKFGADRSIGRWRNQYGSKLVMRHQVKIEMLVASCTLDGLFCLRSSVDDTTPNGCSTRQIARFPHRFMSRRLHRLTDAKCLHASIKIYFIFRAQSKP